MHPDACISHVHTGKENSDPQHQARWPISRLSFSAATPPVAKAESRKRLAEDSGIPSKQDNNKQSEGPLAKKAKRGLAPRSVNSQPVKDSKPLATKPLASKQAGGDTLLVLQDTKKTHSDQATTASDREQPATRRQTAVPKRSIAPQCADAASRRSEAFAVRGQQQSHMHIFNDISPQVMNLAAL
jgi:hypothetical protein